MRVVGSPRTSMFTKIVLNKICIFYSYKRGSCTLCSWETGVVLFVLRKRVDIWSRFQPSVHRVLTRSRSFVYVHCIHIHVHTLYSSKYNDGMTIMHTRIYVVQKRVRKTVSIGPSKIRENPFPRFCKSIDDRPIGSRQQCCTLNTHNMDDDSSKIDTHITI